MPSLITLPKELLLHIISYLPLPIVEVLAKTHNRRITSTCLVLLQPLFTRRRHIKALKSRFGDFRGVETFEFEIFIQETAKFGILKEEWRRVREPTEEDLLERMEWLNLTFMDDLDWLQPVRQTEEEKKSNKTDPLLTEGQVAKLQEEAHEAGVHIPQAFSQLVQSPGLLDRIPRSNASSFHIPTTSLSKATIAIDKDASGYTLPIYVDQEDGDTHSLYLSTDGTHCMLNDSLYVLEGHDSNINLSGVGFGEWLATAVFEKEINDVIFEDRAVEDALKDYVQAMYVRRPEELSRGQPTRTEQRMFIIRGGKSVKVWEYDEMSESWYKNDGTAGF
ncbi:hypothetical protein EK21DRAFT_90947 [Setomelanomma holmii]|uniref:F-box domain-containing protein n=1 Tax=Setomelanomma holmii TaxID=210430 RepID=A0A9P4LKY8_9PLEO|nr:hypothetical protein EK21DRAFT_90947 [Setomelanomma holmii]